jgi:hypothetical protein
MTAASRSPGAPWAGGKLAKAMARTRENAGAVRRARSHEHDGFVLVRVSWVVLALGVIATALFALEPDVRAHPGLALLGITGLFGTGMLRLLAHLLRTPPTHAEPDDDTAG